MESLSLKIILMVAGSSYSIIFGLLMKKIWDMPKTMEGIIELHHERISHELEAFKKEIESSHHRLDVHDRIASRFHSKEVDSRVIARTGIYPSLTRRES